MNAAGPWIYDVESAKLEGHRQYIVIYEWQNNPEHIGIFKWFEGNNYFRDSNGIVRERSCVVRCALINPPEVSDED